MTKKCPTCGQVKDIGEFNKDRAKKDGLRYQCKLCCRQYCLNNKEEIAAYKKQYRQEHKEEIAAYQKQYRQDHKEERAIYDKQHNHDHKDEKAAYQKRYHQTEAGKAVSKKADRKYNQTEAGKVANRKKGHKRRALKAGSKVENFNPNEVLERDGYICQLCGRKTRPDYNQYHPLYPHLDHIEPLSKGGEHSRINTQCLCRGCNLTKSNNGKDDQLRLFG